MIKEFLFGSLPESDSAPQELNALDWQKTARHMVVVVSGAALMALLDGLSQWLTTTDFGKWQMLVGIIATSGIMEIARRYVASRFVG